MSKEPSNERSENRGEGVDKDAAKSPEQFESDTERIMHRHLENKDDVITDEDIASIRVGMTPEFDEATEERFDEEKAEELENEASSDSKNLADNEDPITPLDTLKP